LLAIAGCGGSSEVVQSKPVDKRFEEAMAAFRAEDYKKAEQLFEIIVIQDPASEYADDAQFYLAECYYRDEDYTRAVYAYNRVRASSPFYRKAVFQAGESYFRKSYPYDRDQRETKFAIDQLKFAARLLKTPGGQDSLVGNADSLAALAQAHITDLRTKLARKDFETAQQYWQLDDPAAALVYYQRVIDLYPDTQYFEPATIGKIEALYHLQRPSEATDTADKFLNQNPNSPAGDRIRQLKMQGPH
jgi:outer membrane protein assembly factor BamD